MSNDPVPIADAADGLATGTWRLDPARSSVGFHVRHFYGLMTVKGHLDSYHGSLDLSAHPAVELVIDADSLNTKQKKRDKHLRSEDFFDVANHPQVRFEADTATLDGATRSRPADGCTPPASTSRSTSTPPSPRLTASSRSRPPHPPTSVSSE